MDTEIRLKELLKEAGADRHGVIQKIARAINVNRHTVRKLYYNQVKHVSLETLAKLCDHLEQEYGCQGLPASLFGVRPPELLQSLAAPGRVTVYWAARERNVEFVRAWVSRDDAAVAARFMTRLSKLERGAAARPGAQLPSGPDYAIEHVLMPDDDDVDEEQLAGYVKDARRAFERMREDRGSAILIGSQRANLLTELYVAELFGCDPFEPDLKGEIPLYLKYRDPNPKSKVAVNGGPGTRGRARRIPSCFGGYESLIPSKPQPGIYYREGDEWGFFPSDQRRQEVGVLIVRRDPGVKALELVIFGLSGIATAAMGKLVCERPALFWPLEGTNPGGPQVTIYVCAFKLSGVRTGRESIDDVVLAEPEIVELDVGKPPKRRPQPRRRSRKVKA